MPQTLPSKRVRVQGGTQVQPKMPTFKTQRRIKMPQAPKRPLRFQARSVIKTKELGEDPYWFALHVRGPYRERVGEDPLEARAVSASMVRGTLPERILWKYLVQIMRFVPDIDFSQQSSLQGGRVDTGGIVADFMFPILKIILQVQGPTHDQFLRMRKDDEQTMALSEMGYTVYHIPEEEIYDEVRLEDRMRKIFNLYHSGGADSSEGLDDVQDTNGFALLPVLSSVNELKEMVKSVYR